MNRTPYIPLVLTVLLAAACTKPMPDSEISDSQSTSRSYIFFEPEIIEAAETRADIPFEHDSFGVMGFVGNSAVFSGHTGGKAEVRKEGDLYTYSPLAQWQGSQNHNFYGFYPYSLSSSVNTGADNIPYITYTQPTTLASMLDVMTAKTGPVTKQSYVTLTFTHRLWALDVKVHNMQAKEQYEQYEPTLTVTGLTLEIDGVPGSGTILMNGTYGAVGTSVGLSETFTTKHVIESQGNATINGENSLLLLPCMSFTYRLTIEFENAWGVSYTYHYPNTYEMDAEGNPILDANGNTQWHWKTASGPNNTGFVAGSRYTLDVKKVDSDGVFTFNWTKTPWGEWDEEKQEWVNVDVEHTFQ